MDIRQLNEAIAKALNELNDTTISNAHHLRNKNFKRAEQDFYDGADNAKELRELKKKLDRNKNLTNKKLSYLKIEPSPYDPSEFDLQYFNFEGKKLDSVLIYRDNFKNEDDLIKLAKSYFGKDIPNNIKVIWDI